MAELAAARNELQAFMEHAETANERAAREHERQLAVTRLEASRRAAELEAQIEHMRASYEERLVQAAAVHEREMTSWRQESRNIQTEIYEQMRAESSRQLEQLERRHQAEMQNVSARLRAVSVATPPPVAPLASGGMYATTKTESDGPAIQQLRAELERLKLQVSNAPMGRPVAHSTLAI